MCKRLFLKGNTKNLSKFFIERIYFHWNEPIKGSHVSEDLIFYFRQYLLVFFRQIFKKRNKLGYKG